MFEYLITRPMGFIIEHIYNLVSNYGLAIIIFTILIKLILIPLNIHSQKAMKKQQKIQPLMAELQKKYANDQEKLQREMMKIYKENNISMTGGCLPMLIQMPILIGLYQVIQKPLSYLAGVDWANASVINEVIRLKDAMVNLGYNIGNLANATMEQLANNSQIQLSKWAGIVGTQGTALEGVSGGVHPWVLNFNFLGLDLSNAPSAAFGHIMALDFSNMSVILLLLIPVLAVIASVISMKVTQAQTGQNQNTEGQAAQMTKSMNLMMPVMTGTEMCLKIKNNINLCHIPIVLLTALDTVDQNIEGLRRGADDYITKPFNAKILITRCNNLIRNRLLMQSRFAKDQISEVNLLAANPIDKSFLDRVIKVVDKYLDNEDFDIGILCQELGMGRTLLHTKFKALTGMTPNEFILNHRLKKASLMLKNEPYLQVAEISDRLGFGSPRYFSRCFKNQYNVTPMEYRKGAKQENLK